MLATCDLVSGQNGIRKADNDGTNIYDKRGFPHTHTKIKVLNLNDLHILMQGSAHLSVCCHHAEM